MNNMEGVAKGLYFVVHTVRAQKYIDGRIMSVSDMFEL